MKVPLIIAARVVVVADFVILAVIDSDSRNIPCLRPPDGIPGGDYKLVVLRERKTGKKGGDDPGVPLLPARYYKPETSGPSTTITSTTTTLEPVLLTK